MSPRSKNLLFLCASLVLIFSYQNCGKTGFQAVSDFDSVSSLGGGDQIGGPLPIPGGPGTLPGGSTPTTPADPSDEGRRVLKVCATGCPYTLPSQAVNAAQDNDLIEVAAGTYNDCFNLTKNGLKFRGTGGRAHLNGKMCSGKGAIVISGANTVIENFEFSNMAVPDQNGAGIRHQGFGLIVRNSYFHDGENGILAGSATKDPSDIILVENSRFERLGGDTGHSHAVYFGAHEQVIVRNSIFISSRDQGHEFKSRAKNALIECSYLGSLDGFDSYTLNFPDAGNVLVKNSVVEQGTGTSNSGVVDYGSEMLNQHPVNSLKFDQVAFINDLDRGTFFVVRNSTQFGILNSTFVGPGNMYSIQMASESGVVKMATRAAAGYPAYPQFPKPAACTGTIGLLN